MLYAPPKDLETKVGDGIWKFDTFHFGIHPNASVTHDQCPNDIYRRITAREPGFRTAVLRWAGQERPS